MELLDSRQLRAFQELDRNGSFTAAARSLSLTQSAVSHSIKALERSLEVTLFERLGKTVRLTRAGAFQLSSEGQLIAPDGAQVLSDGSTPIQIPIEAENVQIAGDGTISASTGLIARVGIFNPDGQLQRDTDTRFIAEGGVQPSEQASVLQGALEASNASPVLEVSRMIEVQRAYEAGQTLMEQEHQRITQFISTVRDR